MRTLRPLLPAALGLLALAGCRPPVGIPVAGGARIDAEAGWEPPVTMQRWTHIIVHHSATHNGSAELFDHYHRNVRCWENGLGYHFVIGNGTGTRDGHVEVGHRWKEQITGAHVGGRNNIGKIGVCLVGNFDREEPTPRQRLALLKLVRFLQVRCGIRARRVQGHCEVVRAGYTHCPGRNFSMPLLRSRVYAEPPPLEAVTVVTPK